MLRGPPEISAKDLQELLSNFESLDEMQKKLQSIASLNDQVAALKAEIAALRNQLCPAPAEHEELKALRKKMMQYLQDESPRFEDKGGTFEGTKTVTISGKPGCMIYVTTDESDPTFQNFQRRGPAPQKILLDESCLVKASCSLDGQVMGKVVEEVFMQGSVAVEQVAPLSAAPPMQMTASAAPPRPAGIGMLIEKYDNSADIFVKAMLPGGPASRSGKIKVFDILFEVDQQNIVGMSLHDVFEMIHGPDQEPITLTLRRSTGGFGRSVSTEDRGGLYRITLIREYAFEGHEISDGPVQVSLTSLSQNLWHSIAGTGQSEAYSQPGLQAPQDRRFASMPMDGNVVTEEEAEDFSWLGSIADLDNDAVAMKNKGVDPRVILWSWLPGLLPEEEGSVPAGGLGSDITRPGIWAESDGVQDTDVLLAM
eukprot:CAMPEP_0184306628 /NCGR_PEP_ID=MMETSP1049-20130417/15576_1 /TAXON_ID=77928 /ORGANISM="Proteomonas sulcata, Strain CCMP704" /LENGTH=424 /DNA_ID=CAMNT_0026618931 /DNA_START=36 /DNA_END=1310 /DNA_ORIENTATION=-